MRDDEGPSREDLARFGGETRPCPKCRADVYDEAEWCHKCGHVLSEADESGPSPWFLAGAAAVVVAIVLTLVL